MNRRNLKLDDLITIADKPNPTTTTSPLNVDTNITPLQGEIAYLGPVSFADGEDWVGVRLTGDSIGRGKNDGTVRGLRYFKRCGINGGLFVREGRVRAQTTNRLEGLILKKGLKKEVNRREIGLRASGNHRSSTSFNDDKASVYSMLSLISEENHRSHLDGMQKRRLALTGGGKASSSSGIRERPRSARLSTSSSDNGTTMKRRPSTAGKTTKHKDSNNIGNLPKSQSSPLSSSSNGTNKQQRMINKAQDKIKLQQSHQSAKQLARDTNNVNTTTTTITSAYESELLNKNLELKNIPNCIEDLSKTTITDITNGLDVTVVTHNSELSSAQKIILSLKHKLISSTAILAQRDETIAAHCKQSTRFQSEIVTLKGKVDELEGEKEGLKLNLNQMVLDKEGEEKRLKEVKMNQDSANVKVGKLRLELAGVRESVEIAKAHTEIEASADDDDDDDESSTVSSGIATDKEEVSKSGIALTLTDTFEEVASKLGASNDIGDDGNANNMEAILCIGNPGTGKSTLLNSTMGTIRFKSGFSLGSGKTNQMEEHECDGILYIDTPGLADPKLREQSAKSINQALREKMKMKILFVMTLEAGHVRQQDQLTLRLVLEAMHDEIKENQYGIIINKVHMCDTCKRSTIDNRKIAEELFFDSDIPQSNRIFQLSVDMDKIEKDDALLCLPEKYSTFLEKMRPVQIDSRNVTAIDWNRYETLQKEIKKTEDAYKIMKKKNDVLKQAFNEGEEDVGEEGVGEEDKGEEDKGEEDEGEEDDGDENFEEVCHLKVGDHIIVNDEVKVKQNAIPVDTLGKVVSTGKDDVTIIFKDYNNNRPIQVPKRNCNGIYTNDYVVKKTCRSLAKRGISLGDLLEFYYKLGDTLHKEFNPVKDTTKDIADAAIIPQTKTFGEAYTNSITKPKLASRMVSHSWGNKFRHLVAAIVADAKGIPRYGDLVAQLSRGNLPHLRNELKLAGKLEIVYWVCAFSINQHSIENYDEYGPIYEVGRYGNGHPKCEVDKFDGMFNELVNKTTSSGRYAHHVVAIDQLSTIFSRAWVIAEMVQADIIQDDSDKLKQTFCAFDEESLEPLIQNKVDIKECEAFRSEDKKMILAKAESYYDIHVINRKMNDRIEELVYETKVAIKKEKRIRVLLIGNKGVGKTTLLKAMTGNTVVEHGEHEYEYDGKVFMELSGLANARALKKVSIAITSALNRGGMYKIFFIVTSECGRIRPDDTETISSVLKVAPIKDKYTIIVNKASIKLVSALINDKGKNDFLRSLLPNEPIGHIKCIKCIPRSNCKDEIFNESVQDIFENAPTLSINDKVANIKTATEEDQLKLSKEKLKEEMMENFILEERANKLREFRHIL